MSRRFKTIAGDASLIRVVSLTQTCEACPAQWDGMTDDGREVYVRYRGSCGSVRVAKPGDHSEFSALDGYAVCYFERIDEEGIGGWDGYMDEAEMRSLTAPFVTWPETMPAPTSPSTGAPDQ